MSLSNYPDGAEHDPAAPWNQKWISSADEPRTCIDCHDELTDADDDHCLACEERIEALAEDAHEARMEMRRSER